MRELLFDLTDDFYFPKSAFGGFEGEHNATLLTLRLPERLLAPDAIYYMVFETEKNDEVIFSAPLLPQENAICVTLPKQVMVAPRVTVHAAAYRKEGEDLVKIAKSGRVVLEIKYPESEMQRELSQDGGKIPGLVIEEAVLPESENPVSSRALYDEITALEQEQLQSAYVNEAGELILKKKNRTQLSVGNVVGPQGKQGEPAKYYKYDFNGDGVVNEDDQQYLLYYLNFPNDPDYKLSWWCVPDVDGNGVVDLSDAIALQYMLKNGDESAFATVPKTQLIDGTFSAKSEKPIQTKAVSQSVANALKGKVSGSIVTLKDVSPLEHEIKVKLASKNLLPYPYSRTTESLKGVTFTDNGDGTITANGTATDGAYYYGFTKLNVTEGITYTLSGCPTGGGGSKYALYGSGVAKPFDYGDGVSFTPAQSGEMIVSFVVYSGAALDNVTIKPQLEEGTTATEYTPFADVSTVNLTGYGKNLCPINSVVTSKSVAGHIALPILPAGSYAVSLDVTKYADDTATNTRSSVAVYYTDGTSKTFQSEMDSASAESDGVARKKSFAFEVQTGKTVSKIDFYTLNYSSTSTRNAKAENIQVEHGTEATEYEPYKAKTYKPNADGTVKGVKSLYPATTLLTDTDGVTITAEYNRDLNKVIRRLESALIAIGGEV